MSSVNNRQGSAIYRPLEAATKIIEDHTVVSLNASGEAILCVDTVVPYAVTTKTTKSKRHQLIGLDEFNNGADHPGDIKLTRTGLVDLALDIDHGALAIGDKLVVGPADIGRVIKSGDAYGTNDEFQVATCEEIVAVPGAGLRTQASVKAYLNFNRYGGM